MIRRQKDRILCEMVKIDTIKINKINTIKQNTVHVYITYLF